MTGEELDEQKKEKQGVFPPDLVRVGKNTTNSTTTAKTKVGIDSTGWDSPTQYDFKAPEKPKFEYDKEAGILSVFKPKEPEYDQQREDRLKRVARVNAFGDFVKHLGAFAGGGYAPAEKRKENQNVLRAFAELDKMRDVYEARKGKYEDQLFNLGVQDYADQRNRADKEYERSLALGKEAYDRNYQANEGLRLNKMKAHYDNNTERTSVQSGGTDQFKNLGILTEELNAKRKGGSGKDESFTFYKQGVGDIKVSRDMQIQAGTRIVSELIRSKKISSENGAAMLAALRQAGSSSRIAFQSLFDYAVEIPAVWNGIEEFFGHGMEIVRPESRIDLSNLQNGVQTGEGMNHEKSSSTGYDYGKLNYGS